jgi:hypothetical protein
MWSCITTARAAQAQSAQSEVPDYIPPLDTTIITPTNGSLFDALDAIQISGNAHADAYLKKVTINRDGVEIYSATYPEADQIVDAAWATSWAPPNDGPFIIVAIAEDWAGNLQSVLCPSEVHVASTPPAIDITLSVITSTLQTSPQVVSLGGRWSCEPRRTVGLSRPCLAERPGSSAGNSTAHPTA